MIKSKFHIIYVAGLLLIVGGFLLSINRPVSNNSSEPTSVLADVICGVPQSAISIFNLDPARLEIKLDAQPLSSISRVEFIFKEDGSTGSEKLIGKGVRDTANQQFWRMIWDTRFYDSITTAFPGRFRAKVHFTNNTNCTTPDSTVFSIPSNNSPSFPDIEAIINPPQWSSLVNTSINVNVDFINLPPELHPYVIVNWQPQIGFVSSPFNRNTTYYSGPTAGSGKLRANVIYSGRNFQRDADIAIYSSTTNTNDDSGSQSSGSDDSGDTSTNSGSGSSGSGSGSGSSGDDGNQEPLPEISEDAELDEIITVLAPTTLEPSQLTAPSRAIALILQSNEEVKSCIVTRAGDSTLSSILRENRRPRSDEFNKIVKCFEPQRSVVPSILAPVPPEEVQSETVAKSDAVAIKSLQNGKKVNEEETEQTTLIIYGTSKPNTTVLLYVFSEPLVLATSADENGEWTYTLEDPLDAGEHEVYALVDRGDGVYESSNVASFFIGTAEATEDNPNGLSLELITEPTITASNRSANLYVAATIGIVVFAGVITTGYLLMKMRGKSTTAQFSSPSPNETSTPPEDTEYKKFIDGQ